MALEIGSRVTYEGLSYEVTGLKEKWETINHATRKRELILTVDLSIDLVYDEKGGAV